MVSRAGLVAGLCVAALLAGCAAPRVAYSPQSEAFSIPALNEIVTAPPGANLLDQGRRRVFDALSLDRAVAVGSFMLPPGVYLKEGESSQAEFFSWDEVTYPTNGRGVQSGGQTLKVVAALKNGTLCVQTLSGSIMCADNFPAVRTKATVVDRGAFQATLIYNGKVGNKITLGYRESVASMARPAFSNAVEYDLSASKVLVYKGARIEVLDANNEGIRYRVLSNFTTQ
jgi:hypothetical protein